MEFFSANGQTTDELLRKSINGEKSIWIEENGGLEKVLQTSLTAAVMKLADKYSEDMEAWRWGDYHKVQFYHPLSNVHPILAYFFTVIRS